MTSDEDEMLKAEEYFRDSFLRSFYWEEIEKQDVFFIRTK